MNKKIDSSMKPFLTKPKKTPKVPQNSLEENEAGGAVRENPRKKVVIVDRFDRIPGVNYLTIGGNHVQIVHNDLSFSGWALSNISADKADEVSQAGALSHYIPVGQRIFLPSKDIQRFVDSADKPEQANMVLSLNKKNHHILISEDSIWTVDPNEPFIEETPLQYDLNRKIYISILMVLILLGLAITTLLTYFVFGHAKGLLPNRSSAVLADKDHKLEDITLKCSNIHTLLTVLSALTISAGVLLYRTFPKVNKLKLKFIHTFFGFIGMLGIILGTIVSIYSHNINNVANFFSLHGFLGLMALICIVIQWTAGFLTLLLPFASFKIKAYYIPFHKFFGLLTMLFLTPSLVTGIVVYTKLNIGLELHARLPPKSLILNFSGLLVLVFGMVLTFILTDYRFRRRSRPLPHLVKESSLVAITEDIEERKSIAAGEGDSVTAGLVA